MKLQIYKLRLMNWIHNGFFSLSWKVHSVYSQESKFYMGFWLKIKNQGKILIKILNSKLWPYDTNKQHLATLFYGIYFYKYNTHLSKTQQHVLGIKSRLNLIFTRIMFKHKSCFKVFNDDTHFSSLYLFIRTINDTMESVPLSLARPSTAVEDDFLGPSNVLFWITQPTR